MYTQLVARVVIDWRKKVSAKTNTKQTLLALSLSPEIAPLYYVHTSYIYNTIFHLDISHPSPPKTDYYPCLLRYPGCFFCFVRAFLSYI